MTRLVLVSLGVLVRSCAKSSTTRRRTIPRLPPITGAPCHGDLGGANFADRVEKSCFATILARQTAARDGRRRWRRGKSQKWLSLLAPARSSGSGSS